MTPLRFWCVANLNHALTVKWYDHYLMPIA